MKKLLDYLFTKRVTPVGVTVLMVFVIFIAAGETFLAVIWFLVGTTFSAVFEIKYGGSKPMLQFGVDASGNPSVRYEAGFAPADAETLNKYANASVNQFKATLYNRLQKCALMEEKGKKFSVKKFAKSLDKDYPIVTIK